MRTKKPLPSLTGLRFFAALAIFNLHYLRLESWGYHPSLAVKSVLQAQITGVSLFFLLSGFILAYAYSDISSALQDRTNFWISRFARIYPVYFLSLLWFAPFILTHRFSIEPFCTAIVKALFSFIPSVFLIQGWFHPRFALSWNGPGWTLSVETVFYILFPFALPYIQRLSANGKLLFCTIAIIAESLLSLTNLFFHSDLIDGLVGFHPFFHICTFLAGMALGSHFVTTRATKTHGNWFFILGAVTIVLLALYSYTLPPLYLKNAAFLPAFALLIYGLALEGGPAKILSGRKLILLGESSYALYLLQFSMVFTLMIFNDRKHFHDFIKDEQISPFLAGPYFYLVALIFSVIVSCLVFKFIETPCRSKIRSYLQARFHLKQQKPVVPFEMDSAIMDAKR